MPTHEQSCQPPAPVTLYPRRYFPPIPRRPLAAIDDRLLAHIVAKLVPDPRPRPPRRRCTGTTCPAGAARRRPSLRRATRRWNDLLGIWRQCDEPGCRRGRRCGGDPLSCLPRYLPGLPHCVRFWFACVGLAAEKNVSFPDALALAERQGEQAVCAHWHTAVHRVLAAHAPRIGMKDL